MTLCSLLGTWVTSGIGLSLVRVFLPIRGVDSGGRGDISSPHIDQGDGLWYHPQLFVTNKQKPIVQASQLTPICSVKGLLVHNLGKTPSIVLVTNFRL